MNTIAPDWTELEEAFSRKDGERVMRFLAELETDELFRINKDSFLLLPYRTDEENRILQQVDICNLQQYLRSVFMEGSALSPSCPAPHPDTWIFPHRRLCSFTKADNASSEEKGREYWLREHALFMEELKRRHNMAEAQTPRQCQEENSSAPGEASVSRAEFHWKRIGEACRRGERSHMVLAIEQAISESRNPRNGKASELCWKLDFFARSMERPNRLNKAMAFSDSSILFLRAAPFYPDTENYSLTLPEEVSVYLVRPAEGGFL